jgi:hypothetical protein
VICVELIGPFSPGLQIKHVLQLAWCASDKVHPLIRRCNTDGSLQDTFTAMRQLGNGKAGTLLNSISLFSPQL